MRALVLLPLDTDSCNRSGCGHMGWRPHCHTMFSIWGCKWYVALTAMAKSTYCFFTYCFFIVSWSQIGCFHSCYISANCRISLLVWRSGAPDLCQKFSTKCLFVWRAVPIDADLFLRQVISRSVAYSLKSSTTNAVTSLNPNSPCPHWIFLTYELLAQFKTGVPNGWICAI